MSLGVDPQGPVRYWLAYTAEQEARDATQTAGDADIEVLDG